jgi:hypothetical protein
MYVLPLVATPLPTPLGGPGAAAGWPRPAAMRAPMPPRMPSPPAAYEPPAEATVAELETMGFSHAQVLAALRTANNDVARAVDVLLAQPRD